MRCEQSSPLEGFHKCLRLQLEGCHLVKCMIRSCRAGKCREIGELMQYRNIDRGSDAIKIESRSFPDGYSDFVSTPIFEDWN